MKQCKYGIAFSGGGAKGAAHCGALQALMEYGIKADVVAGTSAGSIAAVLYASGMSPIDMANQFSTLDFKDLLDTQVPKGGLFGSKPLVKHIRNIIPFKNLEDMPVEAHIVTTCIENGKSQIFTTGEIAPRVVASCSIPVIFQPMVINGRHYVDGGVLMNLPVAPIRSRCKTAIAINLHHASEKKYKDNLASVAMRSMFLMFLSNTMSHAEQADIFINIDTSEYSAYDLSKVETLFYIGYDTAVKVLEEKGFKRQMPQQQLEFLRKEEKPGRIAEMKLAAQAQARAIANKGAALAESAEKLLGQAKETLKKQMNG